MVLDVRRDGGTFFDMQWIGSVLRGHSSPAAAEAVRQYLASLPPDYPPKLREFVLQSSDMLQRAARVRSAGRSANVN